MKDAKTIPGFPGYEITKSGELFSTKKGDPVKLTGSIWQGYRGVKLMNGKKIRNVRIHRLVAEAFLPKPRGKNIVNHIDGNKNNNNVSNLEWTNHYGNSKHYSENLAPVYKVKRAKQKQDLFTKKISVLNHAFILYKDENPEEFTKVYGATML